MEEKMHNTTENKKEKKRKDKLNKKIILSIGAVSAIVIGVTSYSIYKKANEMAYVENLYGPPVSGQQIYNHKFEEYAGQFQNSTKVISLAEMVRSHNSNQEEVEMYGTITFNGKTNVHPSEFTADDKYYDIELGYSEDGIVNSVTVTPRD